MLQSIREDVTRTVARIDFQFQEPEPMPLPDLPDFLTTHIDPFTGEDNSADIDGGALGVIADTLPPMAAPRPDLPERFEDIRKTKGDAQESPHVYLRADRGLDYGQVMKVMGELNRAGLNRDRKSGV